MILVEEKTSLEEKNYLNMVIKQNRNFKFFNNIIKKILFNKRFFSSSFGQINSYKSLFLVTKRFRFFKLIDNRRFLKKNRMFKLKSNYNPRLRIRFISGIRYFGFPVSISRFNMLRFFVSKNYRLRVRVGELSG